MDRFAGRGGRHYPCEHLPNDHLHRTRVHNPSMGLLTHLYIVLLCREALEVGLSTGSKRKAVRSAVAADDSAGPSSSGAAGALQQASKQQRTQQEGAAGAATAAAAKAASSKSRALDALLGEISDDDSDSDEGA